MLDISAPEFTSETSSSAFASTPETHGKCLSRSTSGSATGKADGINKIQQKQSEQVEQLSQYISKLYDVLSDKLCNIDISDCNATLAELIRRVTNTTIKRGSGTSTETHSTETYSDEAALGGEDYDSNRWLHCIKIEPDILITYGNPDYIKQDFNEPVVIPFTYEYDYPPAVFWCQQGFTSLKDKTVNYVPQSVNKEYGDYNLCNSLIYKFSDAMMQDGEYYEIPNISFIAVGKSTSAFYEELEDKNDAEGK